MEETAIKIGDVVMLKSGGPYMTYTADDPNEADRVVCNYFDGGELKVVRLPKVALMHKDDIPE